MVESFPCLQSSIDERFRVAKEAFDVTCERCKTKLVSQGGPNSIVRLGERRATYRELHS